MKCKYQCKTKICGTGKTSFTVDFNGFIKKYPRIKSLQIRCKIPKHHTKLGFP